MKIASSHIMPGRRGQRCYCWFTEQRRKLRQRNDLAAHHTSQEQNLRLHLCRHVQDFSSSLLILTTFVPIQFVELYVCLLTYGFLLLTSTLLIYPLLNSVQLVTNGVTKKPSPLLNSAFPDS